MYGNGQEHISSTTYENGNLETIAQLEAKAKAAGTYTGYFKINEDYYCLDLKEATDRRDHPHS